jgi:hypothetical protein
MINDASITPSPSRDRDNGPKTHPGIKPSRRGGCNPKPPHTSKSPRPSGRGGGQIVSLDFSSGVRVVCELVDEPELEKLLESSPFEAEAERWGDEVYFELPVKLELRGERMLMEVGEVAYWPDGNCLCVFFGPTPMSRDERPVAYSKVKPLGRVVEGLSLLKEVSDRELVRVSMKKR